MNKEQLTNLDVVLYTLYLLSGTTKKVFTEEIAIKSFELVPQYFSWKLYPQYPNLDAVRVALFDAQKPKNGGLVIGRYGKAMSGKLADGWIFSPTGIAWIDQNKSRIAKLLRISQPVPRTDIGEKVYKLENSTAYKKFIKEKSCTNIKPYEFTDFLDASLDTPAIVLRERVNRIKAIAAMAKRKKLLDFLEESEKYFSKLINP